MSVLEVSIIIPSYCPKDYLKECLFSVMNQTLEKEKFEVIIVLNGPKEPFHSEITGLISSYPTIRLLYEEKSGVSNARNKGIEDSKGNFICFIDDDDMISPTYLESLLEISSREIVGVSNVYSFEKSVLERKENFFICKLLRRKQKYDNASFFKCRAFLSVPWAKMIHREIISNHRFDCRFKNGEDALFITSITDNFLSIKFSSDDAIYYVRERVGSASRKRIKILKIVSDSFWLISEYIITYLKHPFRYSFLLFAARIPGVLKNAFLLSKN